MLSLRLGREDIIEFIQLEFDNLGNWSNMNPLEKVTQHDPYNQLNKPVAFGHVSVGLSNKKMWRIYNPDNLFNRLTRFYSGQIELNKPIQMLNGSDHIKW